MVHHHHHHSNEHMEHLLHAIMSLKTMDERYEFFEDTCKIKELQNLSQRYKVAALLRQ